MDLDSLGATYIWSHKCMYNDGATQPSGVVVSIPAVCCNFGTNPQWVPSIHDRWYSIYLHASLVLFPPCSHNILVILFAVCLKTKEVFCEEHLKAMVVVEAVVRAVVVADRGKAEGRTGTARPYLRQILMLNWTITMHRQWKRNDALASCLLYWWEGAEVAALF